MNAANFAFHALQGITKATAPTPAVNIVPVVLDFGGQDNRKLLALASAAHRIADAVHGGRDYAHMVKASDFAVLKAFVAFAESEFALAGVTVRDDAVDQPHSPDESHHRDQERC